MKKIFIHIICFFVMSAGLFSQEEEDKTYLLSIGNESLKNKVMEIAPGKIYETRNGEPISFGKMIQKMKNSRYIYLGETHDSLPMHNIQQQIIQALVIKYRRVAVGLEMFLSQQQQVLNKWSLGLLTEEEFIHESRWYVTWNFHFEYYAPVFRLAREWKIPLYGLNVERDIISKIRMRGWDSLLPEEKGKVPKPDLSHEEHRKLIRTIFENSDLPPQMKGRGLDMMFEGLYRAQSAWDEVMAANAVKAAEIEGTKLVVLAGSGHMIYNLGINRRVWERDSQPFSTVICVNVPADQEKIRVSRSLGDFIWCLSAEERPAFPAAGLRLKNVAGLDNLVIREKALSGAAKNTDFQKGDVILSVDDKPFSDINNLRFYLSRFTWGDSVVFKILRNGDEREVRLNYVQGK
ncbi:MAG: ChaN family lipoprotein [Candidatus Aminicenantes bacterium]|nr:ChaN family lipoprotein [Candidatus Aminicenantes bacterium]